MTAFTPFYQAEDGNGVPYSGAKLYFYVTATSTPKNTFSDAGLTTPNTHPVVADSAGRFGPIYLSTDQNYKVVMTTSADVTIATFDPFQVSGAVDIVNLATLTAPAVDDSVPIYDLSTTSNKKITLENLFKVVALLTDKATPVPADILPITDSAASNVAKRATLAALLAAVNGLTEDTTPDQAADFVLTYDTSASAAKKVKANKVSGAEVFVETLDGSAGVSTLASATFVAGYDYIFEFHNIAPSTDDAQFRARVSIDNGVGYRSTAGDYQYGGRNDTAAGTSNLVSSGSATEMVLSGGVVTTGVGNATNEKLNGSLTIYGPDLGNVVDMIAVTTWRNQGGVKFSQRNGGEYKGTTDDVTNVQFSMSAGTFTGLINVYRRARA